MGVGCGAWFFCATNQYCNPSEGTHIDTPNHFHCGARSLEQINVKELLCPLAVLDIHEQVKTNPDYVVTLADLEAWEKNTAQSRGRPSVALRTDWSKRWPDKDQFKNVKADGVPHSPAGAWEVLKFLCEERHVTAVGHETTDTDPGFLSSKVISEENPTCWKRIFIRSKC